MTDKKIAIFGDIHGNLEALTTVLNDCRNEGVTDYLCTGDVVGYNCSVEYKGRRLIVTPNEKQIVNLHQNLKSDYKVIFKSL